MNSESRKATAEATTSAGAAKVADNAAPTTMAHAAQLTPSRRCTRSRKTRANPTSRRPLGAVITGATGIRQGASGTQTVHRLPIIQLAVGPLAVNETRKTPPDRKSIGKGKRESERGGTRG